jgi:hypothetical protein
MHAQLKRNGEVLCDLISSPEHPLPTQREDCWHDCTILTTERVLIRPTDILEIFTGRRALPFRVSHCRVGVSGWEVDGMVLL